MSEAEQPLQRISMLEAEQPQKLFSEEPLGTVLLAVDRLHQL